MLLNINLIIKIIVFLPCLSISIYKFTKTEEYRRLSRAAKTQKENQKMKPDGEVGPKESVGIKTYIEGNKPNADNEVTCDVLILGAGVSGIVAAKRLTKLGVKNMMVVEGDNRIGGRAKEVRFGGINVELGANWVHFSNMNITDVNPVEDLVKDAGLKFVSQNYEDVIFRYKGENVTDQYIKTEETLLEALNETLDMANRKWDQKEPDINFRAGLAIADWRPKHPIEKATEWFNFDFEFGDEPEDTGMKFNAKIYGPRSKDDMFIIDQRGYSQIVRNMADSIPLIEGENLVLNKYVTDIKYKETGEYPIKVIAKDRDTGKSYIYKSKWAIMTFSIGVLKSDLVSFNPKLPAWKEEVIYMFKMVRYIKVFIKFPSNTKAFWDDNHFIMYVDPHVRGRYQSWQNLEAQGKYFPRGTNILMCTVVGINFDKFSTLSKEQAMSDFYTVLQDMYGDKAVKPEDILIPDWHTNPLFFGSYSNWPIGVSKTTYENLDAPMGHLYMAGEACSRHYNGYMHGAVFSGEKTADDLYNCMEKNICEKVPEKGYGYSKSPTCPDIKSW